ncbi:MAG TPA: Gfo/Idh/MocA family oxidoreductase [Candidatus Paceibacterota bacterium]|nr:Gfo/Idh/MocA family oxidoreductase [Verrucomicrobiota bacterium]HRY52168.1 Gfo/Idh/MocA family oxidoreductase [Candidatus Paceibacterota bacterium]
MNLTLSRRNFLRNTAVVAGALTAFPAAGFGRSSAPSRTLRLAIIGVRGKGAHHIEIFQKIEGVRIVALCDADRDVLGRELQKLEKNNLKADGLIDLRRVLDRKDVDAVVTATPNHWHSLVTVWACQAGKDVYVEKPVSHNVWEGHKAVEAARKYKRIVQTGTQSRTDPALREAFAYLKAGHLGPIRLVRGFCYKRRASIGRVPGPQRIPAQVDFDLWTGPAPLAPLTRKNLHYDWHWVWPTGNGDIGNQGVHEMDMCRWAIGQSTLPPRIMSVGGRFGYVDDAETPNTQIAFYDYQPVPILFEVRGLPMAKGEEGEAMDNYKGVSIGLVVECENGYFAGGAGGGWIFDKSGKRLKQFTGPGGRDHQENFIRAVRSRKISDLNADILEGHLSSALCHLGNIAFRLGQRTKLVEIRESLKANPVTAESLDRFESHLRANEVDPVLDLPTLGPALTFDPLAERFTGDWSPEANLLLKRDYREPFVIREKV